MKIDTSAIEGYAEMTADEKIAALEAYEYDDGSKYKNAVSKANSEAAEYKRQLKDAQAKIAEADSKETEGQTEAERQIAEMQAQLDAMKRDKTVSEHTAKLIANGYDAELASTSAVALVDGDAETFFANLATFVEAHSKAIRADMAKGSIAPNKGNPDSNKTGMTKQKLRAMSPAQRAQFAAQHPDEYAELYK